MFYLKIIFFYPEHNVTPTNSGKFVRFFKNIVQHVGTKVSEWKHIPKDAHDKIIAEYGEWYTAYALTFKPHSNVETKGKKVAYKKASKALKRFITLYLEYPPVNDVDRVAMSIPVRDGSHSPIPAPKTTPEFSLCPRDQRLVRVDYRDYGSSSKARPYGYRCAKIRWAILSQPPLRHEELDNEVNVSKSFCDLSFNEEDRGKKVYVAMYWENNSGQRGPWSDIKWTIVP